jgi:ankyrin repeat protein
MLLRLAVAKAKVDQSFNYEVLGEWIDTNEKNYGAAMPFALALRLRPRCSAAIDELLNKEPKQEAAQALRLAVHQSFDGMGVKGMARTMQTLREALRERPEPDSDSDSDDEFADWSAVETVQQHSGVDPVNALISTQKMPEGQAVLNEAGINPLDAFILAIKLDKFEQQEELMNAFQVDMNLIGQSGVSPLMQAAWKGNVSLLRKMQDQGYLPDLTQTSHDGVTALMYAISRSAEAVVFLLEQGADPNLEDARGYYPLMHCVNLNRAEAAAILLSNGARPGDTDPYGRTALMHAVNSGKLDMVRVLLAHTPAEVLNAKDFKGNTALMMAVRAKQHSAELVSLLLGQPAIDKLATDNRGLTALDIASGAGNDSVALALSMGS